MSPGRASKEEMVKRSSLLSLRPFMIELLPPLPRSRGPFPREISRGATARSGVLGRSGPAGGIALKRTLSNRAAPHFLLSCQRNGNGAWRRIWNSHQLPPLPDELTDAILLPLGISGLCCINTKLRQPLVSRHATRDAARVWDDQGVLSGRSPIWWLAAEGRHHPRQDAHSCVGGGM
ncbi:hypothetical protein VTI74DRAFT_10926 [Chaetomium olivicolor]